MALVSRDLPGLFNGVSQQAPPMRLGNQCEAQSNFYSTVAYGIMKRQGTRFLFNLTASKANANSLMYPFKDSEGNEYLVLFTGDATTPLEIYTTAGVKCTITYEGTAKTYIAGVTPLTDLRATTIADYTLVLNRKKVCQMDASSAVAAQTPFALYWCKKGVSNTVYSLGTTSYTTGDDATTTATNTQEVCTHFTTNVSGCTHLDSKGSVCRITGTQAYIDGLTCSDSYGNTASALLKQKARKLEDLPPRALDGDRMEIVGSKEGDQTNYWVEYVAAENLWRECTAPGIPNAVDATTLPHQLIRTGTATFVFRAATSNSTAGYACWESRKVGDADSAPEPSFIGNTINDIFFYKNRLGMLSEQNALLSRANAFFTFFPETAAEVLDTDPIDMNAGASGLEQLLWAVPHNEDLLLFSEDAQYIMTSGSEVFTTTSVLINRTSSYPCSGTCRPIEAGTDVFFTADSGSFSVVREYFVSPDSQTNEAADITAHCPRYVPSGIKQLLPIWNQDAIFCLVPNVPETLWVYKWYWSGKEKPQSAWFRFDLPFQVLALVAFSTDKVYLLGNRNSSLFIETLNVAERGRVHLDRRITLSGGTFDGTKTTYTLPLTLLSGTAQVASVNMNEEPLQALPIRSLSGTTLTLTGDQTGKTLLCGEVFNSEYVFSEQFVPNQKNNTGMLQGRLQLRGMTLSYTDTGSFQFRWQAPGREAVTFSFSNQVVGTSIIGNPSLLTGRKRFSCMGNAIGMQLSIINNSFFPSTFDGASWEGTFTIRSQAIG